MASLEEQAKQQGPQLEDKTRQAGFYQSKAREYYSQLQELQVHLHTQCVRSGQAMSLDKSKITSLL